ncbi:hypothetical protein XELAEV_18040582mg [Xenopus laevis]|uniref:Uncharacterized protein n=1 Tax=Xenopus laevis TaxID=8355 RepID=A0A974H9G4_XENLA|nr:hypothetical protein XELAEV_18040582mg [Xenopus laevis]
MFRRIFKRVRKLFHRNNMVHPLNCTETESSSHDDVAAPEEIRPKYDLTPGNDFLFHAEEFTNEDRIENPIATSSEDAIIPIKTPILEVTDNEERSDEEESENPTATSMDTIKIPHVTYILVKEAVECLDPECPEDASPVVIHEEEHANAETRFTTERCERFSLLSHLNWSDEEETEGPDKEADRLSLLSLLSWPSVSIASQHIDFSVSLISQPKHNNNIHSTYTIFFIPHPGRGNRRSR